MTLDPTDFLIDGEQFDANVFELVTSARIVRTMEGASSIVLTLDDHDGEILRSGLLTKPGKPTKSEQRLDDFDQAAWSRISDMGNPGPRLTYQGWFTRLVGYQPSFTASDRTLTLTFEDEIAALMRQQKKAYKSSRGSTTRANFIGQLHGASRLPPAPKRYSKFFSPEEDEKQRVRKVPARERKKGLDRSADLTVKGLKATKAQMDLMERVLAVADEVNAGERATLGMLTANIGEASYNSRARNPNSGAYGLFQLIPSTARSTGLDPLDIEGCAKHFLVTGYYRYGGAIKVAADSPDATPGEIASKVEGSDQGGSFYDPYVNEAKKILAAWGGPGKVVTLNRSFEFRAGGKRDNVQHNYWDDAIDLAAEVRWRLFADGNQLSFVSDEWLFTRKPVFVLNDGMLSRGVFGFDAQIDAGSPIAEVNVTARGDVWVEEPGSCVSLRKFGPLDGKWLLWEASHDLLSDGVDLTLRRPASKLAEPAPKTRTVQRTETTPESGTARARIVKIAKRANSEQWRYSYSQIRPYPKTLFPADQSTKPGAVRPEPDVAFGVTRYKLLIDCSSFVTLVYKLAGVPDPNGSRYNGSGYTGTLKINGTKTDDPRPGDLVFYSNPEHVGVYIGGGDVIEMGSTPGPLKVRANYRSVVEYRTYDLDGA